MNLEAGQHGRIRCFSGSAFHREVHASPFLQWVTTAHQASPSLQSSAPYSLSPSSSCSLSSSVFLSSLRSTTGLLPGGSNLLLPPSSFPTATFYHQLDSSIASLPCSSKSVLFSSPLPQPHRKVISTTSIFFSDL